MALVSLLVGAGFAQHRENRRIEAALQAIEPDYQAALEQMEHISSLQTRLAQISSDAELLAYLRHPWPRTQLLGALVEPLPDEITLSQVQIRRAAPQARAGGRPTRGEAQAEEKQRAGLAPAARDLAELRDALDSAPIVVTVSGIARQSGPLHRYLGRLGEHPLIAKADLQGIENLENDGEPTLQFEATLQVRPGCGQPGGPTATEAEPVSTSTAEPGLSPVGDETSSETGVQPPIDAMSNHAPPVPREGGQQ
jgi:Tfp pilus assembly protein PilN